MLNRDLLAAASDAPFAIRHITGEARVLIDPAHRNVIDRNGQNGIATWIACRQTGTITDAVTFIAAQRDRWSTLTWDDLLDIVSLAADGKVRILLLKEEARIHFSLYGNDRLLVQQPHPHKDEKKLVWYIKSEAFVSALAGRAERAFDTAQLIPASSFAALRSWIHSDRIEPLINARTISHKMRERLRDEDVQRLVALNVVQKGPNGSLEQASPELKELAWERQALADELDGVVAPVDDQRESHVA